MVLVEAASKDGIIIAILQQISKIDGKTEQR